MGAPLAMSRYAVSAVVHNLAVARQDGDDAGELLLIDLFLNQRVQALQPLGSKSPRTQAC